MAKVSFYSRIYDLSSHVYLAVFTRSTYPNIMQKPGKWNHGKRGKKELRRGRWKKTEVVKGEMRKRGEH